VTDFAIQGRGYFVLRDPEDNVLYVSRMGLFRCDANGYLASLCGMRVQGYTDGTFGRVGDIRVDTQEPAAVIISWYRIESDGRIIVTPCQGSPFVRGQILLQNISDPSLLENAGEGNYTFPPSAGPQEPPRVPGTAGVGTLVSGQLERLRPRLTMRLIQGNASSWAQGALSQTGCPTDLALQGRGYFVVRDPRDNTRYATRAGAFFTDTNGFLVNYAGLRLQGRNDLSSGAVGDLRVELIGACPSSRSSVRTIFPTISRSGRIYVGLTDGSELACGQVLLQDCLTPDRLVRTNFGVYLMAEQSWTPMAPPRSEGLGLLSQGQLELSQLDEDILAVREKLNFFVQGPPQFSTNATDLAIMGNGFFIVRDPVSNTCYATRNGAFHFNEGSYLVTASGLRVQGLVGVELPTVGDIVINTRGEPAVSNLAANVTVDQAGGIQVRLPDGSTRQRGRILLQYFRYPQVLQRTSNELYSNLEAAQALFQRPGQSELALGQIHSHATELLPFIPRLRLPPKSGFRLLISDLWSVAVIESSTDAVHWTALETLTGAGGWDVEFFDVNAALSGCRFYRLRSP
jgi:flagellar hook protein FlgE